MDMDKMSEPESPPPSPPPVDLLAETEETSAATAAPPHPVSPLIPTPPETPEEEEVVERRPSYKFDPGKYVLMPDLVVNKKSYVILEENGRRKKIPRWELIKEALSELKRVCEEDEETNVCDAFRECVESYNCGLDCSFGVFYDMVRVACELWGEEEVRGVFAFLVDCCLGIEDMFPDGVKLLRGDVCGEEDGVFSKREVLCLVACGFFCCYPERGGGRGAYSKYPRINFDGLFDDKDQKRGGSWRSGMKKAKVNRLICVFHYFRRMMECPKEEGYHSSSEFVIFERRTLSADDTPRWRASLNASFCTLNVFDEGSIDEAVGGLRVDFANKMVGGGTLGNGAAMEEILFSCCPEMIASQLVTRELRDNECLIVGGTERFSRGEGYSSGFRWGGDFVDEDGGGRVAVIDAARFEKGSLVTQLEKRWIDRELTKCYVAFKGEEVKVASGKWGCGVFNGCEVLKCLIQWMACSVAEVPCLELYTFKDATLKSQMEEFVGVVKEENVSVGRVYECLVKFGEACRARGWIVDGGDLFQFILRELTQSRVVRISAAEEEEVEKKREEDDSKKDDAKNDGVYWKLVLRGCRVVEHFWGYLFRRRRRVFGVAAAVFTFLFVFKKPIWLFGGSGVLWRWVGIGY